jgi:ParB-like chromosome segregation protein Spo0J
VLQASDHHARRRIARAARERSLSVRQTEALARGTAAERPARRRKARLHSADAIGAAREVEEALATALGAEVRVRLGRRGGTVEIPFEELSEVLEMTHRIGRGQAA